MTFNYETLGNSSYLVINFDSNEQVINYQMQMLVNNDIKNIVKANKQQRNSNIQMYYNITSKISLAQALQHHKMPKSGLINIIEGALTALEDSSEYQLASAGILFDENYVFVKPGSFEPSFIYVPTSNENVGVDSLKKLILNLIVLSKVEVTNDNFIQVLLETLNNPTVGADEIKKLCIKNKSGKKTQVEQRKRGSYIDVPPVKPIPVVENIPVQKPTQSRSVQTTQNAEKNAPVLKVPEKKEKKVDKKTSKEKNDNPNKNKFLLLQVVLVAVLAAVSLSGVINDANGNMNYTYLAGIAVALCGVDFIIYREMFVNNKEEKKNKSEDKKKSKSSQLKKEMPPKNSIPVRRNVPNSPAMPVKPIQSVPQRVNVSQNISDGGVYATGKQTSVEPEISDFESDDTDVLIADDGAYLELYENGLLTKIYLDKESITVGRLSSQCDFAINNRKVGRIHAEFITRNGEYFVRDYNSTNGTYINGSSQRIQSNVEYPINNGDRITLANVDLTFRC